MWLFFYEYCPIYNKFFVPVGAFFVELSVRVNPDGCRQACCFA